MAIPGFIRWPQFRPPDFLFLSNRLTPRSIHGWIHGVDQEILEVVCGLIERQGQVLACLRPAEKHLGNLWEFPGGKVDAGESRHSALHRELMEELGVSVRIVSALEPVLWKYDEVTICLHPFRCEIESGSPIPTEHQEIRWCAPEELEALDWAQADIPIYREWLHHRNRAIRNC